MFNKKGRKWRWLLHSPFGAVRRQTQAHRANVAGEQLFKLELLVALGRGLGRLRLSLGRSKRRQTLASLRWHKALMAAVAVAVVRLHSRFGRSRQEQELTVAAVRNGRRSG